MKNLALILIGFITLVSPIVSAQKSSKVMWPVLKRNYIRVVLESNTDERNEWKLCNKEFAIISCRRVKNPDQKESKYIHIYMLQAKKIGILNATFQKVDPCTTQIIEKTKIIPII